LTICREWTLVKKLDPFRYARPLYCRSWGCQHCAPGRKAQLLAKAASGAPERFVTLTCNPKVGSSPEERCLMLARAWRVVVQRLRRRFPGQAVQYLAVVEATKQGEPHLHILLRSPWIPQSFLSAAMAEIMDSPIVDIRKVRNQREVVRYVAKYITKAPHHFGTCKRYWCSKGWELDADTKRERTDPVGGAWTVVQASMFEVLSEWYHQGYAGRLDHGDTVYAVLVARPP